MEDEKYKILVVDDISKNVQLLANLLSEKGYSVEFALNGPDAIRLVSSENFDLILLDIMMPGMDGYEVCKTIKKDERIKEIPIIFLTAKTDIESIEKAFESGGIDYVSKPFNTNELLARVKTHVELKRNKDRLIGVNKWLEEEVLARTGELVDAKERAEESDRLKSEFLASMSHEIRTPLNSIVGFSGLIAESAADTECKGFSEIINRQNELLLKIIDDIIDLAKVESGKLEIIVKEFELNEFVNNMFQTFRRECQPYVKLIPKVAFDRFIVNTDPDRLKQIFSNLMSNSIKFTEKGQIEIGYTLDKQNKVIFHVSDTGIGIPEDKCDIIFGRFAKLDKFTQGTGLGLAIVKNIIEGMEGKIWMESEIGKGSTFYFSLPV